jgi:hypothetical protein
MCDDKGMTILHFWITVLSYIENTNREEQNGHYLSLNDIIEIFILRVWDMESLKSYSGVNLFVPEVLIAFLFVQFYRVVNTLETLKGISSSFHTKCTSVSAFTRQ